MLSYKCSAACKHCMYACSPQWEADWISEADLERARALFCYIDHYTHGLELWRFLDNTGIGHQANILSATWEPGSPVMTSSRLLRARTPVAPGAARSTSSGWGRQ